MHGGLVDHYRCDLGVREHRIPGVCDPEPRVHGQPSGSLRSDWWFWLFGVTAFRQPCINLQSSSCWASPSQAAVGVPRLLGIGAALTLVLTGAGVIAMTIWARKKPPSGSGRSDAGPAQLFGQTKSYRSTGRGSVAAISRTRSLAAGSPMVIRRPSQSPPEAYAGTISPAFAKISWYAFARLAPAGNHTKRALRVWNVETKDHAVR